jgi:amino acid adenylation domain-containing protein
MSSQQRPADSPPTVDGVRFSPAISGDVATATKTLVQMISLHAQKEPAAAALISDSAVISYGELDNQSNQLAHYLRELGVGPDVLVGLCLERSEAMVVGALAILKAGGAYLPLDPGYPPERLAFMLNDSRVPVLITRSAIGRNLPAGERVTVEIDRRTNKIAAHPTTAVNLEASENDLAYVIYTSGSDGHPKGVQITHSALLNLISWHQRAFQITPADRASQLASMSFDAAVWELWPYLTAGSSVSFCDEMTRLTPQLLQDWLVQKQITISFVPTALAERLMTMEWPATCALRVLLTGADTLHRRPASKLPFPVVNNYGPTECTVVATSGTVSAQPANGLQPSIGRPIDNVEISILDEELCPVAPGTSGELCIGGAGVARGYLNRPDLDVEKFIVLSGQRFYRTGDLGRMLPGGEIEFIGRRDGQIKIRGFRVEPNEIVGVLDQHPDVQASMMIAREDVADSKQLIAYVVPAPDVKLSHTSLLGFLRERLPDYMVPAIFVRMETLPLNHNGKVDRAMLPLPDALNIIGDEDRNAPHNAPQNPIEERIVAILAELLGVPGIGTRDNFFFLGGHSLLGTQLIARLRDSFGVELSLRRIFDSPTAAELAAEIETRLAKANPAAD